MRAMLCQKWGGPEVLRLGEVEPPHPGPGQALIEVAAAGVNFADTLLIQGKYQEKPAFPFAPGLEIAGRVIAVGEGVERIKPGERVMALLDHGGFAEASIARESDIFAIPDEMSFEIAAGFPITYGTAHGALRWLANLKAEETLVVHGAAGGVGLAAVEVGKALSARVIATAGGPEKLKIAKAHGADELIDYRSEDIRERIKGLTDGRGADVIFDPVGGDVFDASLRAAAWGARILIIGFAAGRVPQIPANYLLVKNISAMGFYWGSYRKKAPEMLQTQFEELMTWFEIGKLKPHISHTLPLEEAGEALNLLTSRKATGKVVLSCHQD